MPRVSLVLVRHATAEAQSLTGEDEDRNLDKKGLLEATKVAATTQLASFPKADVLVTSGYNRALQTREQFAWLHGEQKDLNEFSPSGDVHLAGNLLKQIVENGAQSVWVFSHNPFLSYALQAWAPDVLKSVTKIRKADCIWLRWDIASAFLEESPVLCGYLRKPILE